MYEQKLEEYNDGTDLDTAQQKLAAQVRQVQPALPTNVTPALQVFNPADLSILLLTVTSTEDVQILAPALNQYVLPALQGVSGVGTVTVTGVRQQIVTVTLDLNKLQTYGISLDQVQQALQANNMTMPAGEVTANDQTFAIRVGNTFNSLQDLENLIVGRAGNLVSSGALPSINNLSIARGTRRDSGDGAGYSPDRWSLWNNDNQGDGRPCAQSCHSDDAVRQWAVYTTCQRYTE